MAKEEKPKETVSEKLKEVKKEKYHLSDQVLNEGYTAVIPRGGRLFKVGFNVDLEGKKLDSFASVMEQVENPRRGGGKLWKSTGITYLEDLTDEQLWILANAKVIQLNSDQSKSFSEKFYKKN